MFNSAPAAMTNTDKTYANNTTAPVSYLKQCKGFPNFVGIVI